MRRIKPKYLLAAVALVAVLLRIWGIRFDLPYVYHPDEVLPVIRSLSMLRTGDLNPHFFHWPSLIFYVNLVAYVPYYLVGKLLGVFLSPADIIPPVQLAMGVVYAPMPTAVLVGRLVTASLSVGVVLLTSASGRHLTGKAWVGLLACAMVAGSPVHVQHSRFVTPDTYATFFVIASFLGAVLIFQQGKTWQYALAGICVGLAASSKYNAALILIAPLSAHFIRHGWAGFKARDLYLLPLLAGIAFLATTPYSVLDYANFSTDLAFDSQHYSIGHAGMEGDTLRWYVGFLWQTTGPILVLAVLEIVRGVYSRSRQTILLAAFPAVYFLFVSRFVVRNERTILPMTPFLFVLAASLLVHLFEQVANAESSATRKLVRAGLWGLLVVALMLPLVNTIGDNIRLTTVDSRETARVWIADNLPPGARVAIESYSPYVDPAVFSVQGFGYMIEHPPQWYVDNGFEYLVFSVAMFGRYYADPDRYSDEISRYDDLFDRFEPVRTFDDGGFEVRIYQAVE